MQHHALKASLEVNRRSHTADVCVEAQVTPLEPRRKIQALRFWKNLHEHPRPLTRFLTELPERKRLQRTMRSSFLKKVLRLKKEQLRTCERNLWKKQRQQGGRKDERSTHYRKIHPTTELDYHVDYSRNHGR